MRIKATEASIASEEIERMAEHHNGKTLDSSSLHAFKMIQIVLFIFRSS